MNKILQSDFEFAVQDAVRDFKTASRGARNEWMAVEFDLGYQF